eukprot:155010-Chlamydomonas_euryale.AAC.3
MVVVVVWGSAGPRERQRRINTPQATSYPNKACRMLEAKEEPKMLLDRSSYTGFDIRRSFYTGYGIHKSSCPGYSIRKIS